jgi:GT2 family glycosyltransferase
MRDELMRVHRTLCSPFVEEALFRASLGGGRGDLSTVGRYLDMPVLKRPSLTPYFDREFYAATNPDTLERQQDGLLHFIETGFTVLRAPHPLVDLHFMLLEDAACLGDPPSITALIHALDSDLVRPSPYFDPDWYSRQPELAAPTHGLLRHLLTVGLAAGGQPNRWLDPAWYAARFSDVPKDRYAALRHFVVVGDPQARPSGPMFDGALYLRRYVDVADAGWPPLRHYLSNGRQEGRQAPTETFCPPLGPAGPGPDVAVAAAIPLTAEDAQRSFAGMRGLLAEARQQRKDRVSPRRPAAIVSRAPRDDIGRIVLPPAPAPRLSIVIPVFNELSHTVACLLALSAAPPAIPFEVILADDGSTDGSPELLARVANLIVVRQPHNVGFVRNCNAAYTQCRGDCVLLLNNDAQMLAGGIDRLAAALAADPAIAAAGPKLLYPDGRLQEAGCYIRPNGESEMVGLFDDPEEGGYCRDRDVTYCSGAVLMLRRAAVGAALFDEAFAPAYCEDADLCLRLIAAGHRVRYVHDAVAVHWLSASTDANAPNRRLRLIARNQRTLAGRWHDLLGKLDAVRPIAFYLPQFHATPENDLWWGEGFTEWTNTAKARPSYVGHYQPHLPADLGFYDLRTAEALRRQAALAERYGLAGFCVYYYNFGEHRALGAPLDLVRESPDIPFHWCLCWANENWSKNWDGGSHDVLMQQHYDSATLASVIADAVAHAGDPRYLRVAGKPLFLVYRPLQLPDARAFASACRAAFLAAGFSGVHLVYVESMEAVDGGVRPADLGFDACVEFPPHGRAVSAETPAEIIKPGWAGYRYDYPRTVAAFCGRDSVPYARYPAVFPSWDNTPRQPAMGTSFDGASPDIFRVYIEEKIEEARRFLMGDERLLFINAWNEWAEGAHLEPDTGFGHRWLEALRDALAAKRWA